MPEYKYARARGMASWSPRSKAANWVDAAVLVLEQEREHWPLTVRQLFYRMVANLRYPKTEKDYKALCEWINRARRAGRVPWEALRDDGQTHEGAAQVMSMLGPVRWAKQHAEYFGYGTQSFQPCVVEIHVEAAGMVPQVVRATRHLGAEVYSSGGFASVTAKYEAAQRMAQRDRPTVVLSVGDYDPSGISLYFSTRDDIQAFYQDGLKFDRAWSGVCRFGIPMGFDEADRKEDRPPLFRRVAVTPEQIRAYGFETAPAKQTDKRGNWHGGTVQCEAIPPGHLAELLRAAVLEHYDADLIEELDSLSRVATKSLVSAFSDLETEELGRDAKRLDGQASELAERVAERADWTAGYRNADDDDMEEGIGA